MILKLSSHLLLVLLVIIVFFHDPLRAEDYCKTGKEALAKGDYLGAITALREAWS